MEIHPRHVIYFAMAAFGAGAVKSYINRVLLDEPDFFVNNVSTLIMYLCFLAVFGAGLFNDAYIRTLSAETDRREYLKREITVMSGYLFVMINVMAAAAARHI
ncbi:MAG: hypothetical protein IK130_01895 [Oscillospiraceae bacterium]|nr:hypothetical protein [Oscillospiraceae bacterium]